MYTQWLKVSSKISDMLQCLLWNIHYQSVLQATGTLKWNLEVHRRAYCQICFSV